MIISTSTADLEGELAAEMLRILAGMGVVPSTSGGLGANWHLKC